MKEKTESIKILSKEFKSRIAGELKVNDLMTDNLDNLGKTHYYISLVSEHKMQLLRLEEMLTDKYKDLYQYYKFDDDRSLTKVEIDIYIKADPKFKVIKKVISRKDLEIEYLGDVVLLFKDRGWAMQRQIEQLKLER